MAESGHRFDFDHTQIVASDATKGGRLLKEAWFSGKNSINRHIDMCSAQRTLRTWHMNHWRRSGHQLQDQEKDRIPSVPHDRMDTALTPDWGGMPLKDPVRPADGRQKLDQRLGRNPPTSGMNEDVGMVRSCRGQVNDPLSEPASDRGTVEWTAASGFETTTTKSRGEADDRAWERTPSSRSHAPGVLDCPPTNGVNECVWLAEPSQRREREPGLSEPMGERSGTSVAGSAIRGEDNLVKEGKGRSGRKIERLRSEQRRSAAHTSQGDDSQKRGGRSSVRFKGTQPETVVTIRDEWEGNTQWDRIPKPRLWKMKGRSGCNSVGIMKGVERQRGGGAIHTLPGKQSKQSERNHEEGGEAGIVTDESEERILTGPRVDDKEACDGMQRGSRKVLHPEARHTHTHTHTQSTVRSAGPRDAVYEPGAEEQ